jgi:hypothetical protein
MTRKTVYVSLLWRSGATLAYSPKMDRTVNKLGIHPHWPRWFRHEPTNPAR